MCNSELYSNRTLFPFQHKRVPLNQVCLVPGVPKPGGFESETLQRMYIKVCNSKDSSPPYSPSLCLKEEVKFLSRGDICNCMR